MTTVPAAQDMPARSVICLHCGHVGVQRQAPDETWFWGYCSRCGAGHSLYVRVASVAGWRTGSYVGDGRDPEEFKGMSYWDYSDGVDPRRRIDGGEASE